MTLEQKIESRYESICQLDARIKKLRGDEWWLLTAVFVCLVAFGGAAFYMVLAKSCACY